MSGLAVEYGVTVRQLRDWNGLGPEDMVKAGQRIRVVKPGRARSASAGPSSATAAKVHRVRRGETLTGLAKRYGVSVQALREANGLSDDDALHAGAKLRIPG